MIGNVESLRMDKVKKKKKEWIKSQARNSRYYRPEVEEGIM